MRVNLKHRRSYVDMTLHSRRLWLKIGADILDWRWGIEKGIINLGPVGVWYIAGPAAGKIPQGL